MQANKKETGTVQWCKQNKRNILPERVEGKLLLVLSNSFCITFVELKSGNNESQRNSLVTTKQTRFSALQLVENFLSGKQTVLSQ